MSSPWRAAGRSPTAESCEVRPPTQSHIGKRASQLLPAARSCRARSRPASRRPRAAPKSRPLAVYAACATSIPLRVSFVPPDFEMTTVSVCARPPGGGDPVHLARHAVGVGVVEEEGADPVVAASRARRRRAGGRGPSRRCRSTRRFREVRRRLGRDLPGVDVGGEGLHARDRLLDGPAELRAPGRAREPGASSGRRGAPRRGWRRRRPRARPSRRRRPGTPRAGAGRSSCAWAGRQVRETSTRRGTRGGVGGEAPERGKADASVTIHLGGRGAVPVD